MTTRRGWVFGGSVGVVLMIQGVFLSSPISNVYGIPVPPFVTLGVSGGIADSGKTTTFTLGGVGFGNVNFVHPEQIATGDAFLVDKKTLRLEAILQMQVDFGGVGSVKLSLSRLGTSANPFSKTWYAASASRSAVAREIYFHPMTNDVITVTAPQTVPLRLWFDIGHRQNGRVADRFRLTATGL